MCPVDKAALLVPDVFARKADSITSLQDFDTWCDLDIMVDQYRLPRRKPQDKSLMTQSLSVVR